MICLDSDSDSDADLALIMASKHYAPSNGKTGDFMKRNLRESEGSLDCSTKSIGSTSPRNTNPTGIANMSLSHANLRRSSRGHIVTSTYSKLKAPPSYPSHIQRKVDEFTAEERQQAESKKRSSLRRNGEKPKRKISMSTSLEMPESLLDIDAHRTSVITQDVDETATHSNESGDEDISVHKAEKSVSPAGGDSDATLSLSQESVSSTSCDEDHSKSSLLTKEEKKAPSEVDVSSPFEPTGRQFDELGTSQGDPIELSSDSEVENEENNHGDSNLNLIQSEGRPEGLHPQGLDSTSSRFPRKCKNERWNDEEKKKYKNDHPCIGTKGRPIKSVHRDRKCESCGYCRTCTSPPWCTTRELHSFKEEQEQKICTPNITTKDAQPYLATPYRRAERKRQVVSLSPTRKVSSKRKHSVDEKASRKSAKGCATQGKDEMMIPRTLEEISTRRDSKKRSPYKLAVSPTKDKKKRKHKKKKKKFTKQGDDETQKIFLFLAERVMKCEKELDERKHFKTEIPPALAGSEETNPQQHLGIPRNSAQASSINFIAPEDLQRAVEGALQNISLVERTPFATTGFAVRDDSIVKPVSEYTENGRAVPYFSQSAQVVTTSVDEQVFPASQIPIQASEVKDRGNQDGRDLFNDAGGTDSYQEPPRAAIGGRETQRMEGIGSTQNTNEIATKQDSRGKNDSETIRRLRQQRDESEAAVSSKFQRVLQQRNGSMEVESRSSELTRHGTESPQQLNE
ncbi:unnamed protein product [Cylindrotheca closterium]|uniref:Uncharacterized protein n=1 Tax=Cylindrotheca closterium TaxID=2856 RepID=A0AAD2CTF8_9STRA|nr:unnamed protein product [Cylindrotheca closterium]